MPAPNQAAITIPLSMGEIYNVLCPDCQKAVVDLVSTKAGPELLHQAIAAQFAGAARPQAVEEPADVPR